MLFRRPEAFFLCLSLEIMLNLRVKSTRTFLKTKFLFSQTNSKSPENSRVQHHDENTHEPSRDLKDFKYPIFLPTIDVSQFLVEYNGLTNNEVSEKLV